MSGLGVILLSAVGTVVGLLAFGAAMLTPGLWRARRFKRLAREVLLERRERLAQERAAEVLPRHPMGWPVTKQGGVYAANGPEGRRDVYSLALCRWVDG